MITRTVALNVQNKIQIDMSDLIDSWKNILIRMKEKLFDGSQESIKALHSMITEDKMLVPGCFVDAHNPKCRRESTIWKQVCQYSRLTSDSCSLGLGRNCQAIIGERF
jgi:hypothetical protein